MIKKLWYFRVLLLLVFFFAGSQKGLSQNKTFQIGVNGGFMLSGELETSFGATLVTQFNYFFSHKNKFHHYATAGFTTDLNGEGANLYAYDLGIGTQYDLFTLWNKPVFATVSVSGLYLNQKFSTELIGGTVESNFDEFGYKANIGIGYQFSNRLSAQIQGTQFNTNGTTLGLALFYSF